MRETRSRLGFRRWTAELFDQQLWCLGRDIKRPEGNILLDLGMCVYPTPDANRGSSVYTAAVEPGGNIFLWGFGALYSEPGLGGVFLRRYDFAPRLTPLESGIAIHDSRGLGPLVNPVTTSDQFRMRTLLPRLVGWFAKYEHWIAENFGSEYRNQCLASRGQFASVPAADMAAEWERATKKCKRYRERSSATAGPWKQFLLRLRIPTAVARTPNPRPSTWGKS
jgi:hypothetical protein